eukprot:1895322-Pleurochrysis_carterae.AAC.1
MPAPLLRSRAQRATWLLSFSCVRSLIGPTAHPLRSPVVHDRGRAHLASLRTTRPDVSGATCSTPLRLLRFPRLAHRARHDRRRSARRRQRSQCHPAAVHAPPGAHTAARTVAPAPDHLLATR